MVLIALHVIMYYDFFKVWTVIYLFIYLFVRSCFHIYSCCNIFFSAYKIFTSICLKGIFKDEIMLQNAFERSCTEFRFAKLSPSKIRE